jgi:DNA invertase Pin-like site-specific DNA recombinase
LPSPSPANLRISAVLLRAVDAHTDDLELDALTLADRASRSSFAGTPTGRLFLNIVGSIGQFEREIMLERQKEGIAAAKAAGRYKGRVPTYFSACFVLTRASRTSAA